MRLFSPRAAAWAIGAWAALASAAASASAKPAPESPLRPPAAYARCAACHATAAGAAHGIGPNLFGVAGAKAGTRPGYAYSPALRESGLKWSRETLSAYMADPAGTVPGTKMMSVGAITPADRTAIAQYLEKLK